MTDQPWDLNQTWPVGWKSCQFTNAPKKFLGPSSNIWGAKKHQILDKVLGDFRTQHHISPVRNVATTNKMLVSIYNVSPKSWPTFRDLWPRNGWNAFAYCPPTFGGHYVATIKVATSLVIIIIIIIIICFLYRLKCEWTVVVFLVSTLWQVNRKVLAHYEKAIQWHTYHLT